MSKASKAALGNGGLMVGGCSLGWASVGLAQFGARAAGERLARMMASPNFAKGKAQNLIPTPQGFNQDMWDASLDFLKGGAEREPGAPLPTVQPDVADMATPVGERLRATWLGHSTVFLEVDGTTVLTDPVLSERASPFRWSGPKRFHPAPLGAAEVPIPDVVLISHDHYDHLDMETVQTLAERGARFVTALGVGAHLEAWGVAPSEITELDWWEEITVGALRLVCCPSRHFSGRTVNDRNATLWSSWALVGPRHRLWFSGDTGPFPQATEIGARFGPFDLTMIEVGAWNKAWGTIHLGPEEAIKMHQQVGGKTLLPVHWGTFALALHAWYQPIQHIHSLAAEQGVQVLSPIAGRTVTSDDVGIDAFWLGAPESLKRDTP